MAGDYRALCGKIQNSRPDSIIPAHNLTLPEEFVVIFWL